MASHASFHIGPHSSIPDTASPGLLFLKHVLPGLDRLSPPFDMALAYMNAGATFTINGGTPVPASELPVSFEQRSQRLSAFRHDLSQAWDIKHPDGTHTILFESTSATTFKSDPEQREALVPEFSVMELVEGDDGALKARSVRTFMDSRPVENLGKEVQGSKK